MTGVGDTEGLDYLIYRFKKEAEQGKDGRDYLSRDAFLRVLTEVVEAEGEEGGASSAARVPSSDCAGGTPSGQSPEEQRSKLHNVFDTFDRERKGAVLISEFVAGLCVILDGSEEERLTFAFNGLDTDGDGVITQQEFLAFFKHYFTAKSEVEMGSKLPEDRWRVIQNHLQMTFRATDRNRDGTVDVKEFMAAVRSDPDHPFSLILDSFHTLSDSVRGGPHVRSPARHGVPPRPAVRRPPGAPGLR